MATININKQKINALVKNNLLAVIFFAASAALIVWLYVRSCEIDDVAEEIDTVSLKAESMIRDIKSLKTIENDFAELKATFDELSGKLINFGSRTELFSFFFEFEKDLGIKFTKQAVVSSYNLTKKTGISIDSDLLDFKDDMLVVEYNVIFTTTLARSMDLISALLKSGKWIRVSKLEYKETKSYESTDVDSLGNTVRLEVNRSVEMSLNFVMLGTIKFDNLKDA